MRESGQAGPYQRKIPRRDRQSHRLVSYRPISPRVFRNHGLHPKLVGQSLSALGTSSLENVATVRGLHSLSEAMLLLSLALLRLVSSEHFGLPPSRFAVGAIFLPV